MRIRRLERFYILWLIYKPTDLLLIYKWSKTTYKSTEDLIKKLQELKGKTKLKFYKNLSNYYDEMNIRNFKFEEDPFSKNAQGISKLYHGVLLLKKFLQTKLQVKNIIINYYDLYYTVIKNRDEKEKVKNKKEKNEKDYINYEDFIIPDYDISIKPRETILN